MTFTKVTILQAVLKDQSEKEQVSVAKKKNP